MRRIFSLANILILTLGMLLGVFFSNYRYFELNKEISISDLFIFIMTSIIGLYIANNIQKALTRRSTIQALYQQDIRDFISDFKVLEDMINSGSLPFTDLKVHLRKGNMRLRSIISIYSSLPELNISDLNSILNEYNSLKMRITSHQTSLGSTIMLNPTQQNKYHQQIEKLKGRLVKSIISSQPK